MTDQEAHAKALRRIEAARRTSAVVLDLGDLSLVELPKNSGNCGSCEKTRCVWRKERQGLAAPTLAGAAGWGWVKPRIDR
jgi:hypothetical protein